MAKENRKIVKCENFAPIREQLRNDGKTIVLCHGVFDLVHYGHIEHLQEASAQGDVLVVSVTAAKYVNKGPGRPYFSDQQRLKFLAELECVDYVVIFDEPTAEALITKVHPDVYVKGGDYTLETLPEGQIVKSYGGEVELVTLVEGRSTTNIIKKIQERYSYFIKKL